MSILYRFDRWFSLRKLVRVWKLPHTSDDELIDAVMCDAITGFFDQVDDGLPGIIEDFDGLAEGERLTGEDLRSSVRAQMQETRRGAEAERAALSHCIAIARPVVFEFAKRRGLPLPPDWAPEQPAAPEPPATQSQLQCMFDAFAADEKAAGRRVNRESARKFAKKHRLTQKQAEPLQHSAPGKKGRPKTAQ